MIRPKILIADDLELTQFLLNLFQKLQVNNYYYN